MITWPAWDQAATLWINQHHNPALDVILVSVSWLGEMGVGPAVLMAALLIFGRRRERLLTVILVVGLAATELLIMPLIRAHYFRPRPYVEFPDLIRQLGVRWTSTSFPSSHAHMWTQVTLLYGLAYRRWLGPLLAVTLLTYYGRPYAGMHHVLDVVGGAVLGGIMGLLEVWVASRLGLLKRDKQPDS